LDRTLNTTRRPPPPQAVVFLYGGALRSPIQRSHHLARHFADRLPVIYAPYRSPVELLIGDRRMPEWPPLARHPNVHPIALPATVFLSRRSRAAAVLHGWLAARRIRTVLQQLAIRPADTLLFLESATAVEVARHFPEAPVMYDCCDDFQNWHGARAGMRKLYAQLEAELAGRASWIVLSIPRLGLRFAGAPAQVIVGLNAVDFDRFAADPAGAPHPSPADIARLPRPRLLYVGVLSAYVDAELITALAREKVGSIVLVGPVDPRAPIARLRQLANVHFLGRKAYEGLPAYLHAADVGLIPGTRAAASDCIPSKLLMYCAAGLPVVARHCSSLAAYRDRLWLAHDAPEFARQVKSALREPAWQVESRVSLAREHTWKALSARLLTEAGLSQ
jgi:hypothetical protein